MFGPGGPWAPKNSPVLDTARGLQKSRMLPENSSCELGIILGNFEILG